MTFGNPDFVAFARAHHAGGARVETAEGLVPIHVQLSKIHRLVDTQYAAKE